MGGIEGPVAGSAERWGRDRLKANRTPGPMASPLADIGIRLHLNALAAQ